MSEIKFQKDQSTKEAIAEHIQDNLYDPQQLKPLEDYVEQQIRGKEAYDFDSNLYLMKMYSLYPSVAKKQIIVALLLQSLMNLPESDFTALIYLIPVHMQSKIDQKKGGDIETVLKMGEHLEDCEFDSFWMDYNSNKKSFEMINIELFEKEIRRYICNLTSTVYQDISVDLLCELLELSNEKQLIVCLETLQLKWTIEKSKVMIPKTEENSSDHDSPRKTQFLSTDAMSQILATYF